MGVQLLFLGFAGRVKVRTLCLSRDTHCMSAVWGKTVGCRVVANAVVPEGNVIFLPLEPNMNFLSRADQLVQIVNDHTGFCFRYTNYIRDKA